MNITKKNCPSWLRVILKLPRRWKHCLRDAARKAAYWSDFLVMEDSTSLLVLIENTNTPNFEEFERRLNEAQDAWGKDDPLFASMSVIKDLLMFKAEVNCWHDDVPTVAGYYWRKDGYGNKTIVKLPHYDVWPKSWKQLKQETIDSATDEEKGDLMKIPDTQWMFQWSPPIFEPR